MFDLVAFLRREGVPFIERGPNVQRGNVNIRCPFCGDDPSYHMGVSITSGAWGCWRNQLHRGKKPHRLLRAVLNCSWERVEAIVGTGTVVRDTDISSLQDELNSLSGVLVKPKVETLEMPSEFKVISDSGYGWKFLEYLESRGFPKGHLRALVETYDLRYAMTGPFAFRLIVPFRVDGRLVGWTGRDITGQSEIRYKNWPTGDASKRLVLNFDQAAEGGRRLYPVEGPLDTLKLDFYGQAVGVRAVGVLGVAVTEAQIAMIARLTNRFDETRILLDDDALSTSLTLESRLSVLKVGREVLPPGVHDPGELTPTQVLMLCRA